MVWNIQKIKNKMFGKIITDKSVQIVTALDKCNIPYFARFNKKEISFVYDCDYIDSVMEILKKAESDGYEDLQRELTNKKNTNGILILLPAVAYYLNMSDGQLK